MAATWNNIKLGELVSFKTGKLDSNAAKPDGAYPFFTCSQETFRINTYSFDTECVLLAGNNAAGVYPLKYFRGKFDAYQRTYVLRSLDERRLLNRFLYFGLRLQLELLKTLSTGVATKFLTLTILRDIPFPVPPVNFQEKIAAILSAYDDLIENNTRRIQILERMAQALYQEWFVNFRFPGHARFKLTASPLGKVPQGWYAGTLDDALLLQRGFDLPKQGRREGRVPIYAATGITGWHDEAKVKAPGVVTGRSGSLGTVVYIQENFWPLNTALWVKEFRRVTPLYAYFLLSNLDLASFNAGAAVPTLNRNDVRGLPVVLPAPECLGLFDEHALPLFALKRNLELRNANLRRTRDLLLHKLISGALDVSKLDIKTA